MATPSPWIEDGNTGRLYMNRKNKYGEIERRYAEEPGGYAGEQSTDGQPSFSSSWTPQTEELGRYTGEQSTDGQPSVSSFWTPQSEESTSNEPQSDSSNERNPLKRSTMENERTNYNPGRRKGSLRSGEIHHSTRSKRQPKFEDEGVSGRVLAIRSPVQEPSDNCRDNDKAIVPSTQEAPAIASAGKRHIANTEGDVEPLDDSYKVWKYSFFFRPGRVFSVLWTEPFTGTDYDIGSSQFIGDVSYVNYKERVHSKLRLFVVVRLGDRFCTCLPVTTLDGSLMRKTDLGEYGLIYSSNRRPPNVGGIEKLPLKVNLSTRVERLKYLSCVHYGRVYTLETNVKVKNVGELDSESIEYLQAYYSQVNFPKSGGESVAADAVPVLSGQSHTVVIEADKKAVLGPPESPKQALDSVTRHDGSSLERNDQGKENGGRLEERRWNMEGWMNTRDKSSRSPSFSPLSVRSLVNPDPVQRALLSAWPLNVARISLLQIGYQLEWDLLLFMRKCFPAGQKLGDVMTLTGGVLDAQALSCREYLTMAWPSHETLLSDLLEAIESLIDGNPQASFHHGENVLELRSDEVTSRSNNYNTQVSLGVFATHDIHAVILSALSWLCAAIRYSPFTGIAHSSISIEGIMKRKRSLVKLNLVALEELPPEKTCWHVLFPHAVIAKGFPIKGRRQGHGLEISFSNMFLMSRSMSFIEYDGGLLSQGLRSLLIPIKLLVDDNALQWHYASKQKHVRSEGRIASVLRRHDIKEWHKVLHPSTLIERRCFLGWAEEVSIMIGTEGYLEGAVRGSGIEKHLRGFGHKLYDVTLDSRGLGYPRETGIQLYMPIAVPSTVSFDARKDISDYLIDEQDADVLIYDTQSKTASLLPHAYVALLLVRKIVARRQYELFDGRSPSSIGFTPTKHNGGQEAIAVLLESLSLKVRKAFARKSAPLDDLSVTIRQVLKMIETARCGMEDAEIELERTNTSLSSDLLQGIDFMDLVLMPSRLVIRQIEIGQAWTYLGGHHSTVLFCRDLGEAIECSRPENQCGDWLHVPRGRNYLVMTGLTIVHLLEQFEDDDGDSRFGQHLEWNFPDDPMHIHRPGLDGVAHVQSVELVRSARGQKGIRERLSKFKDSGFIFTDAKAVPDICYQEPIGSIASRSLHEESDGVGLIQQLSAEVLDNSSSTSLETGGSSVPGQLATDSMPSNETQDEQDPNQAEPHPNLTARQTVSPSIPSFVPPVTAIEVEVMECKADMQNKWRKPRWLPGSSLPSSVMGTEDEKQHTTIQNRIYQIGKGKGKAI